MVGYSLSLCLILGLINVDIYIIRYALKKKNDIIWEFFPNVGPPPPPPPFLEPLIIMALLGPKMAEHGKLADVPKRSKRAQNDPK